MLELIIKIGELMVANLLQILAGCLLSLPIYRYSASKEVSCQNTFTKDMLMIVTSTFAGLMLPLDIFGIIPVIAALYSVGAKVYIILPAVFSNVIFNMLVPFNDVSFVWRTGIRRVILAFAVGALAGLLLKILKVRDGNLIRANKLTFKSSTTANFKNAFQLFTDFVNSAGIYIILGIILNEVFHGYILFSILNSIFNNPYTASFATMFTKYDVVNPFFLLMINIMFIFINFIKLSAILLLLKPKGFALYAGYLSIWAGLLAVPAFI